MGPLIITIPEELRQKLGPDAARALAELLSEASVQTRDDVIEIAAGRFERRLAEEIGRLRAEIGGLEGRIGAGMGSLEARIMTAMGSLEARIMTAMGSLEGRMTRWMFVFWIGQIGALIGILFAFFRP